MLQNVIETTDEMNLKEEIVYLLHVRPKDRKFERNGDNITNVIKNLVTSNEPMVYNERVLIVLIESGYLQ